MKVLIGDQPRSGYVTVTDIKVDGVKTGDTTCLDWMCDDGTVEEIVSPSITNIPADQVRMAIANWADKLSSGGMLKVSAPDIYQVTRAFNDQQLTLHEFCAIVYGDRSRSAMDMQNMMRLIEDVGLVVKTRRYDGMSFYLEAQK
jgi:hypothetical protein